MSILQELHNSQINGSIQSVLDGWSVKLGDERHGYVAEANVGSEAEAYDWLERTALERYPESRWAQIRRQAQRPRDPDLPGAEAIASARADEDTYD